MADLGAAMSGEADMCMLGGGNPAHIPEVEARLCESVRAMAADSDALGRVIGDYDGPQGNTAFLRSLATLLSTEYGWEVGPENIALTQGSQNSFFALFNIFGGTFPDGSHRRILLPLTPAYIGYSDAGLQDDFFVSTPPVIEMLDDRLFKYHIDFDAIEALDDLGAICVSRPTNPTGNVLTDVEVTRLDAFAKSRGIPLILDNAYGTPFPNIIFTDAEPLWNENTVVCMSLSKFGLPATRTGIVIAREELIGVISGFNAVCSLAPTSMGAAIAQPLVESGEILTLSRDVIRPYYEKKAMDALALLQSELKGLDCYLHTPEGALFLWLWCKGLPITSEELYERLKARGVLVVSGHYYFPGRTDQTDHQRECIRITFSQSTDQVERGLVMIAEEVRRAYEEGGQ